MHGKISATNHRFPNGNGWQFLLFIASLEIMDFVRKFLTDSLLCLKQLTLVFCDMQSFQSKITFDHSHPT